MVTAVMVVVTLVEPPTPMATMMAVASLLDRRTSFACGRQLAENVAGGGGSLSAADCNNAGKSARDGSEGEESSHVSSFFYFLCAAACIFLRFSRARTWILLTRSTHRFAAGA